jgi:hypothetical protein
MRGILSYDQMLAEMTSSFNLSLRNGRIPPVRMVGILFARPTSRLAKEEIVPNLDHFHYRSGEHIDFFCAGYGADDRDDPDRKSQIEVGDVGWRFNSNRFNAICVELEKESNWEYSGATDLILTNARFDRAKGQTVLEFETMVKCYLDEMIRIKAIPSVEEFFERIFKYAKSASGEDPAWGFSDAEGFHVGKRSLINVVLSLLPKNMGEEIRRVAVFAACDGRPSA